MGTKLNRESYQELINGDLAWLSRQDGCLEKTHVVAIVENSTEALYSKQAQLVVDRLRGQLQNCVNHLDRAKRRTYLPELEACIESANKALYETLGV